MRFTHRDVKPDNIIVCRFTGNLKVTDFGTLVEHNALNQTSRDLAGTAAYADVSVLRGEAYGHEVDIYSLGTTVWKLAKGRNPFYSVSGDARDLVEARRQRSIVLDSDVAWPVELVEFIDSCLAPPDKRPTSAQLAETRFLRRSPDGQPRKYSFTLHPQSPPAPAAESHAESHQYTPDRIKAITADLLCNRKEAVVARWIEFIQEHEMKTLLQDVVRCSDEINELTDSDSDSGSGSGSAVPVFSGAELRRIVRLRPKSVDELVQYVGDKAKSALGEAVVEQIEDFMRSQERARSKREDTERCIGELLDIIIICLSIDTRGSVAEWDDVSDRLQVLIAGSSKTTSDRARFERMQMLFTAVKVVKFPSAREQDMEGQTGIGGLTPEPVENPFSMVAESMNSVPMYHRQSSKLRSTRRHRLSRNHGNRAGGRAGGRAGFVVPLALPHSLPAHVGRECGEANQARLNVIHAPPALAPACRATLLRQVPAEPRPLRSSSPRRRSTAVARRCARA